MKTEENIRGFHFPLINPTRPFAYPIEHYLEKILEEVEEFKSEEDLEKKRKEAVDILHSAETFVRHYFERTSGKSFEEVKADIVKKNEDRGYYQF